MLVSYNWIKDFFPNLTLSPDELAEAITRTGIEIEGVEKLDQSLKNIVVGEILTCEKHPSADKLNKCLVQTDAEEPLQIICGAPNVLAGQKVVVAKVGARLPGGHKIKRAKLRGEVSEGMICSLQELGFEAKVIPKAFQDGIFVLPNETVVGASAITSLGLNDAVLDMAITPNRADALSYVGIAHEVGAIIHEKPNLPNQPDISESGQIKDKISINVKNPESTPYYAVKMIENIEIKDSPLWLQSRLMKAGIRPHNSVVDVTNYINLLYGQPLHAFDYDQIGSKEIVIRSAHQGEEIKTLDGEIRKLTADYNVITNGKDPIALAGIMGGENSEVTDATTTVLLEGAIFDAKSIGKASRELALRTEASIRYDKGSDYFKVDQALAHGAALIAELSNGKLISGVEEVDYREKKETKITTNLDRINRLLGTTISANELETIFARLDFPATIIQKEITVTIPSRRWDISIEADILEEVARIYGYDRIPATLPKTASTGGLSADQLARRITRRQLEATGLSQSLTYSLTSEQEATRFALSEKRSVRLKMPMSEEHSHLRTSIVPGLIHALSYNIARKNTDIAFYELGNVFYKTEGDALPIEEEHLAGLISGNWQQPNWQKEAKAVDFFILKGILTALHSKLGLKEPFTYTNISKEDMHPGRTANIYLADQMIGYIGQIHPTVEKEYNIQPTYVFELNYSALLKAPKVSIQYQTIPRYPEMTRDIAIVVNNDIEQSTIENIIWANGTKLLTEVHLFDIFSGESIGKNKKSLAYTLTYLDPERTLVEEEVTKVNQQVITALEIELGATIR